MTGQRHIVAQVLSAAIDHPDVEEVRRRAHAIDQNLALDRPQDAEVFLR